MDEDNPDMTFALVELSTILMRVWGHGKFEWLRLTVL